MQLGHWPRHHAQITVDGDTSTNDTVVGLASGAAGNAPITDASSPEGQQLEAALTALLQVCVMILGLQSRQECEVADADCLRQLPMPCKLLTGHVPAVASTSVPSCRDVMCQHAATSRGRDLGMCGIATCIG